MCRKLSITPGDMVIKETQQAEVAATHENRGTMLVAFDCQVETGGDQCAGVSLATIAGRNFGVLIRRFLKSEATTLAVIIQHLRQALLEFQASRGYWPERVILWRDSIGDGQLGDLFRVEKAAMARALRRLNDNINLTVIAIYKRFSQTSYLDYVGSADELQLSRFHLVTRTDMEETTPSYFVGVEDPGMCIELQIAVTRSFSGFWIDSSGSRRRMPRLSQFASAIAHYLITNLHDTSDPSEETIRGLLNQRMRDF